MTAPASTRSLATEDLSVNEMYLLLRDSIVPRPIAWVSTIDDQGRSNLAPYSFFNVCSAHPPVVGFAIGPRPRTASGAVIAKDTLANIRAHRELVVIGDTPNDVRCARAIGAYSVAVPTGNTSIDVLRAAEPDVLVETLEDTAPILKLFDRIEA